MSRVEVGVSQGELLAALARAGCPPPRVDTTTPGWVEVGFEVGGRAWVAQFPSSDPSDRAQRELWRRILTVVRGHVAAVSSGARVVEAGALAASPPAPHTMAAPRPSSSPTYRPPPPLPPPPPRRWNVLTGRRPIPGRAELPPGRY